MVLLFFSCDSDANFVPIWIKDTAHQHLASYDNKKYSFVEVRRNMSDEELFANALMKPAKEMKIRRSMADIAKQIKDMQKNTKLACSVE